MKPSLAPSASVWRFCALTTLGVLLLGAGIGFAGDWPAWRGPRGTGISNEKDLPLVWGGKTNENVLWKVSPPGRSYSSPIVWGGRVFITSAAKLSDQELKNKQVPEHYLTCYQAETGKELWRTVVPKGPYCDEYFSIPTPITDGKLVYAWYGSGVAVAVDFDGKIAWRAERPGPYRVYPGVSSSPVLFGDSILILVDQGKDSFLLALDKNSGTVQWEHKRPKMRGSTNSSPILIDVKGKKQLVVAGDNVLQGLDPTNGNPIWWCAKDGGYWGALTAGSGLVYTDSGGGRGVAVDPTGTSDVDKTHVKWVHKKVPEGLGCPVIAGDYLYRAHKPGVLKCWKVATGEEVFDERLEGISFLASPIATADGRIYFASAGHSYVIKSGVPQLEVLAHNQLRDGGDDGPSPAAAGGRLFLRNGSHLWCIGKK